MSLFFQQGFRPFFLGAGLWAALGMVLWIGIFRGDVSAPLGWAASDWHAHEMLFGYVSAVIAGFLLTAVPNWTGIAAPKGARLMALVALWLAGRLVMLFAGVLPPALVAIIDISFFVVLDIWLVRALLKSGNTRNLVVAGLIGLFIVSNAAMHAGVIGQDWMEVGKRGGLVGVLMIISLIGGRVIPAFTRNWLAGQGPVRGNGRGGKVVPQFGLPDKAALATTALALVLYAAGLEGSITALAFLAASIAGFARLSRWQTTSTGTEPLVWIMHLGYFWLPVGYALMAISLGTQVLPQSAALHALTSGGVGTMTLAIMTRASLGHTGRPLVASRSTVVIYSLVTMAAILRVVSASFPEPVIMYSVAGITWALAFAIFSWVYGRSFFRPGPGQKV